MPATAPSTRSSHSLLFDLTSIVGAENILSHHDELVVYECDGYVIEKNVPDVVVFPTCRDHVVEVVKACNRYDVPFVPRGAGTSLAGGTLAVGGGVMICLTRMKQIVEINLADRYAIVEPGVIRAGQRPSGARQRRIECHPGRLDSFWTLGKTFVKGNRLLR